MTFSKICAQQFIGNGKVSFISKAPLETITASSEDIIGIIDLSKKTFAFTFPVNSFNGFNSPLQKEHFNDYYLETQKYPKSVFTGKFVGVDSCKINCGKTVFAKGKLMIHGIEKVVTIPLEFKKEDTTIKIKGTFKVLLNDYDISIPKILEAKISPVIEVDVNTIFKKTDE